MGTFIATMHAVRCDRIPIMSWQILILGTFVVAFFI
jgi:hypothetical protein